MIWLLMLNQTILPWFKFLKEHKLFDADPDDLLNMDAEQGI